MKKAVVGLVAHVDAGKTTLAEALLYLAGSTRKLGRVDHGDSFLDYEDVERQRGITVFSKQASLELGDARLTLIDTPGHVDFCAEAERTMQVLDCAVLIVAANEPLRGHTKTLWRLLEHYHVPTLVFVNKLDIAEVGLGGYVRAMADRIDEGCVDFTSADDPATMEAVATASDAALEEYLETGSLSDTTIQSLFMERRIFPCVGGSALGGEGVRELVELVCRILPERSWPKELGARVYKVTHDRGGERVAWLKVTGGTLRAKETVAVHATGAVAHEDKINQLRRYNGAKFEVVRSVEAGDICAATGLAHAVPGSGLGSEASGVVPVSSPVLDYAVWPKAGDAVSLHDALRQLADEDPLLGVSWDEEAQLTRVQLMGVVQLEVIQRRLLEEYSFEVEFGAGSVMYRETIAEPVEGIGHFEPLRHYAEVHLLLEPLPRGSGIQFGTVCREDDLDRNWQRLILTNAMERPHRGVLTGSPITDVRITLLGGRAHPKHTEGGDFRQATYRAIRQGLMQAQSILLEPLYEFELEVPTAKVGRALSDLQRMSATFDAPLQHGELVTIVGTAPVSEMGEYALDVITYTAGLGCLTLRAGSYDTCHNAESVIESRAYDPETDLAHTPDSVFCSHGAGYTVKWHDVSAQAHVAIDPSRYREWQAADEEFFGRS